MRPARCPSCWLGRSEPLATSAHSPALGHGHSSGHRLAMFPLAKHPQNRTDPNVEIGSDPTKPHGLSRRNLMSSPWWRRPRIVTSDVHSITRSRCRSRAARRSRAATRRRRAAMARPADDSALIIFRLLRRQRNLKSEPNERGQCAAEPERHCDHGRLHDSLGDFSLSRPSRKTQARTDASTIGRLRPIGSWGWCLVSCGIPMGATAWLRSVRGAAEKPLGNQ